MFGGIPREHVTSARRPLAPGRAGTWDIAERTSSMMMSKTPKSHLMSKTLKIPLSKSCSMPATVVSGKKMGTFSHSRVSLAVPHAPCPSYTSPKDVIFRNSHSSTRADLERSARNGRLGKDHRDVWKNTKQARNRCKKAVGPRQCKRMGYCGEDEFDDESGDVFEGES